jgi:hypothetical protein
VPIVPAVTQENISAYTPNVTLDAVTTLKNLRNFMDDDGISTYLKITTMSPNIVAWRDELKMDSPTFIDFAIRLPRGDYDCSVIACYQGNAFWYMGAEKTDTAFNVMDPSSHNPYNEVTFSLYRDSRDGNPSGYSNDPHVKAFKDFLQQSEGFTIIYDTNNKHFWFRSNADPTKWFETEPWD